MQLKPLAMKVRRGRILPGAVQLGRPRPKQPQANKIREKSGS
jgi:hypothetical protein